jgi:hypothetical protein
MSKTPPPVEALRSLKSWASLLALRFRIEFVQDASDGADAHTPDVLNEGSDGRP